jgi:hypothetical protein
MAMIAGAGYIGEQESKEMKGRELTDILEI